MSLQRIFDGDSKCQKSVLHNRVLVLPNYLFFFLYIIVTSAGKGGIATYPMLGADVVIFLTGFSSRIFIYSYPPCCQETEKSRYKPVIQSRALVAESSRG